MIDRDSLRLSRLFKVHEQDNTDQVHSIKGVPVYTTKEALQFVARNYMSADRLSLRIIPDVGIRASVRNNSALTFNGSGWVDDYSYMRISQISVADNLLSHNQEITLSISSTSIYGLTKLSGVEYSERSDVVATPAYLKQLYHTAIKGGISVITNIENSTWWLDDDRSRIYTSGSVVKFVSGFHTIHFEEINGYVTPENKSVNIVGGTFNAVLGEYTSPVKLVTCILSEPDGKWSVDGSEWYVSGQTIKLNPGSYTLRFSAVSGKTASNQRIVVNDKDLTIPVFYN